MRQSLVHHLNENSKEEGNSNHDEDEDLPRLAVDPAGGLPEWVWERYSRALSALHPIRALEPCQGNSTHLPPY